MAASFSSALGVDSEAFARAGVLDAIIGIDTRLFLDPFLLKNVHIKEFKDSRQQIEAYYENVITLLLASKTTGDRAWRTARQMLTFREQRGVAIGYGMNRSNGSGIGPELARRLIDTAQEIVGMGIKNPEIFELIGLFEKGFGADRLSDMTIRIIRPDIFRFTQRVAQELGIKRLVDVRLGDEVFKLPQNPIGRGYLLLLPMDLLSPLPVALDWDGIEQVVAHNEALRKRINQLVGTTWKEKIKKRQLREVIFSDPENIRKLVATYKATESVPYDFAKDLAGETSWYSTGSDFAHRFKLVLPKSVGSFDELESVVDEIVAQFKRNIEVNNLKQCLYVPQGLKQKPRHERYSQLLFYAVADSYCEANNLDISREPNGGSGPVDFKISRGYQERVIVEIKLSSNQNLIHGFEKQLPAYQASERTHRAFYVVIRVTESENQIKELLKLVEKANKEKRRHPVVVVIDAVIQPSASKRK